MSATEITGNQIRDGSIQRKDIDVTTTGQALIRKVLAGSGISLSSTGGDAGTGDVTISASVVVNPFANNTFIKWRDAANLNDLDTLSVDASNNVVINADHASAGIHFNLQDNTAWSIDSTGKLIQDGTNGNSLQLNKLTASTVPVLDGSKNVISSTVTATELGYVSGVTSAIQTQLTAKMTNPLTTTGDIIYGMGSTPTRLAIGSSSQVLTVVGGVPSWQPAAVSGITSLNLLTDATQTFATGTAGTDFGISSASGVHTFNIPSASGTNRGLVTTGAQTFAGAKTFSSAPILSSLSASLPLKVDGSNVVTSAAISLISATEVTRGTANQVLGTNSGAIANEFKTLSTGTSGSDFAIVHGSGTIAFNIPDASGSNRGLITTGAQSLAGVKTFSSVPVTDGLTGTTVDMVLTGSTTAGKAITLNANNSTGLINLQVNASTQYQINASGELVYTATNTVIHANTSAASDTKSILITGGGAANGNRGGQIQLFGVNNVGSEGAIAITSGNNASSTITITTNNTSAGITLQTGGSFSEILFNIGASTKWSVTGTNGEFRFRGQNGNIGPDTSAASHTRSLVLAAGGSGASTYNNATGGTITMKGINAGTTPGSVLIEGGNATQGAITFQTNNATPAISFNINGANMKWKIDNGGNLVFGNATGTIGANTADGSDSGQLLLNGGGSDTANPANRGAYLQFFGNEAASFGGWATLAAGNVAGAKTRVITLGAFPIELQTNSVVRVNIDGTGIMTHKVHSGYTSGATPTKTTAAVDTVNTAAATGLYSLALADNTTYMFSVDIVGRLNSTTAKGVIGSLRFGVYRNNAGTATLGTVVKEANTYGASGYDFNAAVSSNSVSVNVNGDAAGTVSWMADVKYLGVSTAT